jgi:diguanylate cyclase (GGDEF)-like protein
MEPKTAPIPGRVLLVDDQEVNRDMLGRRLERAGYHVVMRSDALTIESDIVNERIDIVLLDWMMPERSGLDALRGLRLQYDAGRVPVIVATALDDEETIALALSAGANDYVSKPINVRALLARIKVQIERRAAMLDLDQIRSGLECAVQERTRELTEANEELSVQIAEREAAEQRAQSMAMHDALTGLPNRRHLHKALEQFLPTVDAHVSLAVVAVDLDRFKPVNDLYGHAVGDELLVKIAQMFVEEFQPEGFVARLGGDEFILIIPHQTDDELIGRLTALVTRFDTPITLSQNEVSVGVSLGVAMAPADGHDADSLMRRADVALYRAKEEGRGRFAFFETGMDARANERAMLEQDLRAAVRADTVEAHFQPLVQLGTGAVCGYEVLARWTHPERGPISPSQFIPLAEETGLIGDLCLNVLARACREALDWPDSPRLSVNISPVQLRDPALAQKVLRVLSECGFPPARLEIEITESALVEDFDQARRALLSFKNQGMHIALDDFGTGYSSLRHLRELPFDVLKIDQSFVHDMTDSDEASTIIKTIIHLAKNLGLGVTAEGIETLDHANRLTALGCELGQGYYFGRAVAGRGACAENPPALKKRI